MQSATAKKKFRNPYKKIKNNYQHGTVKQGGKTCAQHVYNTFL